jgi:hypothetical protein
MIETKNARADWLEEEQSVVAPWAVVWWEEEQLVGAPCTLCFILYESSNPLHQLDNFFSILAANERRKKARWRELVQSPHCDESFFCDHRG